jgi:hypothetical protein
VIFPPYIPVLVDRFIPLTVERDGVERKVWCIAFDRDNAPTMLIVGCQVSQDALNRACKIVFHPDRFAEFRSAVQ